MGLEAMCRAYEACSITYSGMARSDPGIPFVHPFCSIPLHMSNERAKESRVKPRSQICPWQPRYPVYPASHFSPQTIGIEQARDIPPFISSHHGTSQRRLRHSGRPRRPSTRWHRRRASSFAQQTHRAPCPDLTLAQALHRQCEQGLGRYCAAGLLYHHWTAG